MNNLKTQLLFLLFLIPTIIAAQYHPESLIKWDMPITAKCSWPKKNDVDLYRISPVIFVKSEVPEINKKRLKKKGDSYLKQFNEDKAFALRYNQALDSLAKEYYPFDVRTRVMSEQAFEKKKKSKGKKVFAYVTRDYGNYMFFGLSNKKKAIYALPFTNEMRNDNCNMAAEFQFIFHRLENFLIRMEKGSRTSSKTYKSCMKELNEKIETEISTKTLLIPEKYVSKDLSKEDIKSLLKIKYKIVSEEEINKVILDKADGYLYLKVLRYQGYQNQSFSNSSVKTRGYFTSGALYIVDPKDGVAFNVNFSNGPDLSEVSLSNCNAILNGSNGSLR